MEDYTYYYYLFLKVAIKKNSFRPAEDIVLAIYTWKNPPFLSMTFQMNPGGGEKKKIK
jgi:hypothetical protein